MSIKWNESYSVGVKIIDLQHQKLFEILNAVEEQIKRNAQDYGALDNLILDLQTYVEFHFTTEQKYFDEFHYEDEKAHLEQHAFYVKKVRELHESCEKKESDLSVKLLDFIEEWIKQHINVSDKKYTQCFNEHGLK